MSDGSIRERLAMLSRAELAGLVVALVVTLGGAGLWYSRSLPKPVELRATAAPVPTRPPSASPSPTLIVDVAGAVRKPGVYEFRDGDRVIDAIRAAGGPTAKATLDALNLAAPLTDGAQVLVPLAASAGTVGSPTTGTTSPAGSTDLINVNTASATELEALPGIGEVISQAIVDYRTENGPFGSVDDLLDVSGIGDATLADIRDLITV